MIKKANLFLVLGLISLLLIGIVFFLFDLEISQSVVQSNPNFIFLLFAAVGEFPIYIGPLLFGLVYGFTSQEKNIKLGAHLVGLLTIYIALMRLSSGILEVFFNSNLSTIQYFLLSVAALLIYIFIYLLVSNVEQSKLMQFKDISFMYLIISISSFLLVTSIKFVWGRPRFEILSDSYQEYTNFLVVNGFSNSLMGDGYRSFPSGHTNSASCIFIIALIIDRITDKKIIRCFVDILCIIYILTMAISRVCLGKHYASDVLFGFIINCSCLISVYGIFKKKGWLYVRGDKC